MDNLSGSPKKKKHVKSEVNLPEKAHIGSPLNYSRSAACNNNNFEALAAESYDSAGEHSEVKQRIKLDHLSDDISTGKKRKRHKAKDSEQNLDVSVSPIKKPHVKRLKEELLEDEDNVNDSIVVNNSFTELPNLADEESFTIKHRKTRSIETHVKSSLTDSDTSVAGSHSVAKDRDGSVRENKQNISNGNVVNAILDVSLMQNTPNSSKSKKKKHKHKDHGFEVDNRASPANNIANNNTREVNCDNGNSSSSDEDVFNISGREPSDESPVSRAGDGGRSHVERSRSASFSPYLRTYSDLSQSDSQEQISTKLPEGFEAVPTPSSGLPDWLKEAMSGKQLFAVALPKNFKKEDIEKARIVMDGNSIIKSKKKLMGKGVTEHFEVRAHRSSNHDQTSSILYRSKAGIVAAGPLCGSVTIRRIVHAPSVNQPQSDNRLAVRRDWTAPRSKCQGLGAELSTEAPELTAGGVDNNSTLIRLRRSIIGSDTPAIQRVRRIERLKKMKEKRQTESDITSSKKKKKKKSSEDNL